MLAIFFPTATRLSSGLMARHGTDANAKRLKRITPANFPSGLGVLFEREDRAQ